MTKVDIEIDIYNNPLHAEIFRAGHDTAMVNLYEPLKTKYDTLKTSCDALVEALADVIRNSHDIIAKKRCSCELADHEARMEKLK